MFEDHIYPALAGDPAHFIRDLLLVMIDGVVGAELARLGQLALVAGGSDDLGTQHLRNLDRSRSHARSCA